MHFARLAVLQSWQNNRWDGTRQETRFLYPHIKKKREMADGERLCVWADPVLLPLVTCVKEGDCLGLRTAQLLDFPAQLLFTHRLAHRWPEPPAICFIYPLVQITMHTAFSFLIPDDYINTSLGALVQLKLWSLGTDTLMIFCVSVPHLWSMCLVHGDHLCLMETKQSTEQ